MNNLPRFMCPKQQVQKARKCIKGENADLFATGPLLGQWGRGIKFRESSCNKLKQFTSSLSKKRLWPRDSHPCWCINWNRTGENALVSQKSGISPSVINLSKVSHSSYCKRTDWRSSKETFCKYFSDVANQATEAWDFLYFVLASLSIRWRLTLK